MLLDLIRSHKAEIDQLARRYGARRLRVFGSVARREEGPESDVDFLVDFEKYVRERHTPRPHCNNRHKPFKYHAYKPLV